MKAWARQKNTFVSDPARAMTERKLAHFKFWPLRLLGYGAYEPSESRLRPAFKLPWTSASIRDWQPSATKADPSFGCWKV